MMKWVTRIEEENAMSPPMARGQWKGYLSDRDTAGPMRGRYTLVRWNRPTIAVAHDNPDECLRLARLIEEALS